MKRLILTSALSCALLVGAFGQSISFGFGDAEMDAALGQLNIDAKVDLKSFSAEVTLQWGTSAVQVASALAQGLEPVEVYLAAALSRLSGKPLNTVITAYKNNRKAGWGALAKSLGIKPGSRQFKELKATIRGSRDKLHNKK